MVFGRQKGARKQKFIIESAMKSTLALLLLNLLCVQHLKNKDIKNSSGVKFDDC